MNRHNIGWAGRNECVRVPDPDDCRRLEQPDEEVQFERKKMAFACFSIAVGLTVLLATVFSGCRPPPTGTWAGEAIDCGAEIVRRCGPAAIPHVNACVGQESGDWRACLLGLIPTVACGAEQVLACVLQHTRSTAATAAAGNHDDVVSARMAERAGVFMAERRYVFKSSAGAQ